MNPFGTARYFAEPHTKQRCCVWAVWQLQAKGSSLPAVQKHVSYEFFWIRRTYDYIFGWMFNIACCL